MSDESEPVSPMPAPDDVTIWCVWEDGVFIHVDCVNRPSVFLDLEACRRAGIDVGELK